MKCSKCGMIEMKVSKVEDNKMYFRCKRCGNEEEKELSELEHQNNK